MKILILSHFDPVIGPIVFFQAPGFVNEELLKQIPELMNIYNEKHFFVHMFGGYKSANLLFDVPNEYARGGIDMLLISMIITDEDGDLNVGLSEGLLKGFVKEFQKIENAYEGLYVRSNEIQGAKEKFNEIQKLFFTFFKSFPEESVLENRRDAKIFVFGLSQAGKTTIIQKLHNIQKEAPTNTVPTTNVGISRIFVNNVSILTYDAPGQSKFMDLWTPYLENQDGLVFVLDVIHKSKYNEAREILQKIANLQKMKNLPLLILFNKVDIQKPNIKNLKKILGINELGERPIKCFKTSGYYEEGIIEAFTWLAQQLAISLKVPDRGIPHKRIDEGIIFSRWDENVGLRIIGVYPNKAFIDPEVIAIRCFSISQFIFGGEKFQQISFILPFTHLNAKAAIYFDYIDDTTIRGGKLPLSLVIFYDENIADTVIDHFTPFIFEKLAYIKYEYKDKEQIFEGLKDIFEKTSEAKVASKHEVIIKPTGEIVKKTIPKVENLEDFLKDTDTLKYFTETDEPDNIEYNESSIRGLKCEICHADIGEHSNFYHTDVIFGFLCDNCFLAFSKDDLELLMNAFNVYDGHFGKDKTSNISDTTRIQELIRELNSKKDNEDLEKLKLKLLHKGLLYGISPEQLNNKLKL